MVSSHLQKLGDLPAALVKKTNYSIKNEKSKLNKDQTL
jgi:hypothetical protein